MDRAATPPLQELPLHRMCAQALARDPAQSAIEFGGEWTSWGRLRAVAERVGVLVEQSGTAAGTAVVFVPRNRPSSVAAFLGLLAQARSVRMVYAFQSPA